MTDEDAAFSEKTINDVLKRRMDSEYVGSDAKQEVNARITQLIERVGETTDGIAENRGRKTTKVKEVLDVFDRIDIALEHGQVFNSDKYSNDEAEQ